MKNTIQHVLSRSAFFKLAVSFVVYTAVVFGLTACTDAGKDNNAAALAVSTPIQVFKNPSCKCCGKWVRHIEAAGFSVAIENTEDLNAIKSQYGIAPHYQSCHTAVAEGYAFEGHIPAHIMQQFLIEKPQDAIGLSVPGMPAGSPGMEMGNRQDDYDVLLLKKDGSTQVYAHVSAKLTSQN